MKQSQLCARLGVAMLLSTLTAFAAAADFTQPTKQHEAMAHEVGVWDADVSMWMSPEAEPMKSKGVETNELLGKMWLMSQFEGEFGGEKFVGRSALGYDPIKKKFTGGWVDTMSPFMMRMEGDYDEDSHTLTMMGEGIDVMTGKSAKHKLVTEYHGENEKTFTMYQQDEKGGDDAWQKTMEIKYTRRK